MLPIAVSTSWWCVLATVFVTVVGQKTTLLDANFNTAPVGPYTASRAAVDFGDVDFSQGLDRAAIVDDGTGRFLRVTYPSGGVGSKDSGAQIKVSLDPTGKAYSELYARYRVRFATTFDFVRGGKLPGLCGGTCPTGGNPSNSGFSARIMWRSLGEVVQYMYYPGQDGKFGEDWKWDYGLTEARRFVAGRWYTVETRIKLNAVGKNDAIVQSWIDGVLVLNVGSVTLRGSDFGVNFFYFSTFFGGSQPQFKPKATSTCDFDDFTVTTTRWGNASSSSPTAPAASPTTTSRSGAAATTTAVRAPTTRAATTSAPRPPPTTTRTPPATSARPVTSAVPTTSRAPPSPTIAADANGGCVSVVEVKKVKEYYIRLIVTAPPSGVREVTLSNATTKAGTGGVLTLSSSRRDTYFGSTTKMTSDRELRVVTRSGDVDVYVLLASDPPEKGAELECAARSVSSVIDEASPAAAAVTAAPSQAAVGLARISVAGSGFGAIQGRRQAGGPSALETALVDDVSAIARINPETTLLTVRSVQTSATGMVADLQAVPTAHAAAIGVPFVDAAQLQAALEEAAGSDTSVDATGPSLSRVAALSQASGASMAGINAVAVADTPEAIEAAALGGSTTAAPSPTSSFSPPPAAGGSTPSAALSSSSCGSVCFGVVAAAGAVLVVAGVVAGVIALHRRNRASSSHRTAPDK